MFGERTFDLFIGGNIGTHLKANLKKGLQPSSHFLVHVKAKKCFVTGKFERPSVINGFTAYEQSAVLP